MRDWQGANPIGFEFFRGDSWQLALGGAGYALRAAVLIRAALRGSTAGDPEGRAIVPDSRIAIAVADGGVPDPARVSLSTGPAFVESGRTLDTLTGKRLIEVAGDGPRDRVLRGAARLSEAIMRGWTPAQSESVAIRLRERAASDKQIAQRLGIAPPTLSKRLASARWPLLNEGLELLEGGLELGGGNWPKMANWPRD